MIERGDYVSPTFNYEPRLNKPVLSYWIVAGFYQAFGISVGVQRLPIALAAVGLIAIAAALPARLAGDDRRRRSWATARSRRHSGRRSGWPSRRGCSCWRGASSSTSTSRCSWRSRCCSLRRRNVIRRRRRLFLALMYVWSASGMLTKGPGRRRVPGLVFAVYLLAHRELRRSLVHDAARRPRDRRWRSSCPGTWRCMRGTAGRTSCPSSSARISIGSRPAWASGVDRGPLFYLPVLFSDSFPWALFLVPAAAAWWSRPAPACRRDPAARVRTLLWIWIVVIVGFFSLSAGKQDLYIFPIVPAVTALAGCGPGACRRRRHPASAAFSAALAIGLLLLAAGSGLLLSVLDRGRRVRASRASAIVGAIGMAPERWHRLVRRAASGSLPRRRSPHRTFVALYAVFVLRTLPSFEATSRSRVSPPPSRSARPPGDVVATYAQAMPSLTSTTFVATSRRCSTRTPSPIAPIRQAGLHGAVDRRPRHAASSTCPARSASSTREPTFDVRLKSILTRRPLPQLVVITNKCD